MRFDGFDQIDENPPVGDIMTSSSGLETNFATAAVAIQTADALLIGARAHMGVDSGFPTFAAQRDSGKPIRHFRRNCSPKFQRRIGSSLR